jgi:hypothetical protein
MTGLVLVTHVGPTPHLLEAKTRSFPTWGAGTSPAMTGRVPYPSTYECYSTGPSAPIISRRMILTGASPAARKRSWNSISENLAPIFFL